MSEQDADTRVLRVFGFVSLGLYTALAVFFWSVWSFKENAIDEVVIVVITGALVVLYFFGLRYARRASTAMIVAIAIGVGVIGFITPPFDSTDVFFYMATGWQQARYGSNPYSMLLRNVDGAQNDPMIQNESMERNRNPWLDIPVPYGFLFSLLSRTIAWLGNGNFRLTLGLFSLLNLLMHAGTALFLWNAGKLLPDGNGKVILYLYTWNPFVVLQYLADLHNDIVVAFFIVVAAYLILKDRPVWSLPLLVAAGLIKYIALVLVPFALLFLIRQRRWREAVRSLLLSAGLVALTGAPYIKELASFKFALIWAQLSESTGSLHAFIVYSFRALGRIWPAVLNSVSDFRFVTQAGLWVLFAIFIVHELYESWKGSGEGPFAMIQRWTLILFALIFVASSQFYAWYIGMMLPLALLTHPRTILADCIVALSGAHMLSFTFLRRKAIGYFVVATLFPVLYVLAVRHFRSKNILSWSMISRVKHSC